MKRRYGMGVRLGEWFRGPRAMFAVAPLVVPLILSSVSTIPNKTGATLPVVPFEAEPIDYVASLEPEPVPLPEHSAVLPIEKGDTLQAVFERGGLPRGDAFALAAGFSENVDPRRLRPGDLIRFRFDETDTIQAVEMKVTGWGKIVGIREENGFSVSAEQASESEQQIVVHGTIERSLGEAVLAAGESQALVNDLVDVFQWDIDFFRLQRGDSFSAVVTKRYVGDDFVGYGPVEAARFTHYGTSYEAFRHESGGLPGYYTRTGSPLRKQFLRSPLKYSRVTSGFNLKRFHPVLKKVRPHYGVDYGAPVGTPVMTTADGVVVSASFARGEGNYVRVRHNSKVETWYLHLSRFATGIKAGARVSQGDVIGYVGSTGMSTGPHLDYRVKDSGSWMNPAELKSITADPLGGRDLATFRTRVAALLPQVDPAVRLAAASATGQTAAR